jgi:hypothetical protein
MANWSLEQQFLNKFQLNWTYIVPNRHGRWCPRFWVFAAPRRAS